MADSNPFLGMQDRLVALLQAAEYFSGLLPDQILTEKIADLEFQVKQKLIPLNFGLVVTTAEGKSLTDEYGILISIEDLNITVIHNPKSDPAHTALDALAAAIQAIHGQSVQDPPPPVVRAFDLFAVTGHQVRNDKPPELAHLHVHELHVTGALRLK